jgi:CheY-like chemotaxis protein
VSALREPEPARILVVDDDEPFRRMVGRFLLEAGFDVVQAGDFTAALAIVEGGDPLDLVLTDLRLTPGTPHGFSVARTCQLRRPEIKVVFMTGGDPHGFALFKPEDIVLQKPFKAVRLVELVRTMLGLAPH